MAAPPASAVPARGWSFQPDCRTKAEHDFRNVLQEIVVWTQMGDAKMLEFYAEEAIRLYREKGKNRN